MPYRCTPINGVDAELARLSGQPPHSACMDGLRSAALCSEGHWLCWDTGRFEAASAMLPWRGSEERLVSEADTETGNASAVIAVLAAATARGSPAPSLGTCPLFTALLPSVLATAGAGFEYRVYVGYDVGDPFYDNRTNLRAAHAWFGERAGRLRRERGVRVRLAFLRFLNAPGKPGPAFNYVAAAARLDGADYFFRVNDDSELLTPWAAPLVAALASFAPPNVGVAGPVCREGNSRILTHDFTHRAHQAVFGRHYPEDLSDWFMDGWVTAVYPPARTYRHPGVRVRHRLARRRYAVDGANRARLRPRVLEGRAALAAFLADRCDAHGCRGVRPPPAAALALRVPVLPPAGFRQGDMRFSTDG